MTCRELIERLTAIGVDSPVAEARILIEEYAGVSPAMIPLLRDEDIGVPSLLSAVERREKREPLQYILGHWDFLGYDITVTPDCLIPRPETEILCEMALGNLPHGGRLLDLCTGSGCVALTVLAERVDCTGVGVDISPAALGVAEVNRQRLGVGDRCTLLEGDVTLPPPLEIASEKFHVITANPPYITLGEMDGLEPELSFEPRIALTDEGDGMRVIRGILENYPCLLTDGGVLLMEIGSGAGAATTAVANSLGLTCEIVPDLSGLDRVAVVKRERA